MRKKCIISGGTSGIGFILAKFLAADFDLFLIYKSNSERAVTAVSEIKVQHPKCRVEAQAVDLSDYDALHSFYEEYLSTDFSAPELLLNCAGATYVEFFATSEIKKSTHIIEQNLFSTMYLTHLFYRKMRGLPRADIVNFSSSQVAMSVTAHIPYKISKAGIEIFTSELAKESKKQNLKINCIRPGLVDTPMTKEFTMSYAKDSFIPENFVTAVLNEILSSELNGQIYNLDTNGYSIVS